MPDPENSHVTDPAEQSLGNGGSVTAGSTVELVTPAIIG